MEIFSFLFDIRVVSFLFILPLFLYWFSTRNHDYWKKRGIPYVKPYPFLGSVDLKKNLEDAEVERYNELGRIYGIYEANKPVISVAEPELLKSIFVKDFNNFINRRVLDFGDPNLNNAVSVLPGEDWKRVRTIISPTFSTGKIKRVMSIFEDCAKTLLNNIKESSVNSTSTDIKKLYGAYTMDVIASSAFSTKLDSHKDPENEFVKNANGAFRLPSGIKAFLFVLAPKLTQMLKLKFFNGENFAFFRKVTLEIIKRRKETGQRRNDFLQLLLDTSTEVSKEDTLDDNSEDILANYTVDSTNNQIFKSSTSKHLSMDELVAQCVLFFIAGYHTTATTLSITTYLLAMHEDIQEKLFEEMKTVLESTSGKITYEAVQKMKYLDNIISESIRLYSPAVWVERTTENEYKLGETGITIPKGMIIHIPLFAMHRDPEFFPEPMKFDPDRFSQEGKEKLIPYSFIPFGAGPRNCVGMRFALMEIKVCLVHVLCTFKARKCSETKTPLEFGKGAGVLQPKSIHLIMEPRKDSPLNL